MLVTSQQAQPDAASLGERLSAVAGQEVQGLTFHHAQMLWKLWTLQNLQIKALLTYEGQTSVDGWIKDKSEK